MLCFLNAYLNYRVVGLFWSQSWPFKAVLLVVTTLSWGVCNVLTLLSLPHTIRNHRLSPLFCMAYLVTRKLLNSPPPTQPHSYTATQRKRSLACGVTILCYLTSIPQRCVLTLAPVASDTLLVLRRIWKPVVSPRLCLGKGPQLLSWQEKAEPLTPDAVPTPHCPSFHSP